MIGWVADGQVHTRRIAAGFVHSPGDAFSGRMRPYAHVQLDHEGRIHIVGEQTVTGVTCGSLLRYVVIEGSKIALAPIAKAKVAGSNPVFRSK
jgi:hypothetical protein